MNLWTAIVAIAGIIGIVQIARYRLETRKHPEAEASAEQAENIRLLEERVRTLERIVTDRSETLKRSIEELE